MIAELVTLWTVAAMLTYGYIQARTIWHQRPAVGLDPNTGRYRSARLMWSERRR